MADIFAEIDEVTAELHGQKLSDRIFTPVPPELDDLLAQEPWVSQLAIYGSDVAAYETLRAHGFAPGVLVGHSLGEIAALTTAGVYSVGDGARIVSGREAALRDHSRSGGGMAALTAAPARVQLVIDAIAEPSLVIAAENHELQTVVSGPPQAMETLEKIVQHLRIGYRKIAAPHPFHSPLLRAASEAFADRIRCYKQAPPQRAVFSPILRRYYDARDDFSELLASHLTTPIHFGESLARLHREDFSVFVQCGAGGALERIVQHVLPAEIVIFTCYDAQSSIETTIQGLRDEGLLRQPPPTRLDESLLPGATPAEFALFWSARGHQISARVAEEFEAFRSAYGHRQPASGEAPATPPEAETMIAEVPPAPAPAVLSKGGPPESKPAPDGVASELVRMYSSYLEYPPEVFTDGVTLEAELGIDSVKQLELFARVAEHYGLKPGPGDFRLTDFDTFGKVVEFVQRRLDGEAVSPRDE